MDDSTREESEVERLKQLFPQRLDQALKAVRMTRADLAARTGVAPSTLSAWALGRRLPRASQLCLTAQALGTTIDFLFGTSQVAPELEPSILEVGVLDYVYVENGRGHYPSIHDVAEVFEDLNASRTVLRLISFRLLEPSGLKLTVPGREEIQKLDLCH